MRMKMFSAESFDAAKALIFAEMGEDAVILSEREVDGGVEVRAATDKGGFSAEPFALKSIGDTDPRFDNPLRHRVRDALSWHGAPKRFSERLSAEAIKTASAIEPQDAIAAGLMDTVTFSPIAAIPENDIVLVGPPGHGRTSTAAKLTRRAAVANGEIHPVAADLDGSAGGEQLAAYLERERGQIRVARAPEDLFAQLREIRTAQGRFVLDLPAIAPFEQDDLASLVDLVAAIHAEPVLVLSAEGHPEDQAEAARAFARSGVKRVILTKLDIARRRGGAVAAVAEAGIAISHLAVTPFIGGGLVPAAPQRLAALLMEDAPGRVALKGAA